MYKIELQSIKQFEAEVFFGSIDFLDLNQSAKLSARINNQNDYQRDPQKKDYTAIKNFIKTRLDNDIKKDLPIFPTPLILGIETEEDESFDTENEDLVKEYFHKFGKSAKAIFAPVKKILYIPKKGENLQENVILIVDGQHRFLGVKEYFKDLTAYQNFTFLATFMIGNDRFQQSIVFADVNFNQKPVNKSLMYDILSVLPNERNDVAFAHNLVKKINDNVELKGIVKMLGTGYGIISLAFMVETIKDKMVAHKNGSLKIYFQQYQYELNLEYLKLEEIFIDYFVYIKDNFSEYFPQVTNVNGEDKYISSQYKYMLFKTTGIYGWLMLLNDILPRVDIKNYDQDTFKNQLNKIFKKIIENKDFLFSKDSTFSTGGSGSLQSKFYDELKIFANLD